MAVGICDTCGDEDDQLIVSAEGWKTCPACMVPLVPTTLCDRCGKHVEFDLQKGDQIMYAPPSYCDEPTSFRHAECVGILDCDHCGEPVDIDTEEYGRIYGGPKRDILKGVFHRRCRSSGPG